MRQYPYRTAMGVLFVLAYAIHASAGIPNELTIEFLYGPVKSFVESHAYYVDANGKSEIRLEPRRTRYEYSQEGVQIVEETFLKQCEKCKPIAEMYIRYRADGKGRWVGSYESQPSLRAVPGGTQGSDQNHSDIDPNGNLLHRKMLAFDAANRQLTILSDRPSGKFIFRFVYDFDANGRLVRFTRLQENGTWDTRIDYELNASGLPLRSTETSRGGVPLTVESRVVA